MQPRQGYFQLQQCHSIPSPLSQLLSYGLDFGLPVYKINFFKYFLSFEKLAICLKPFSGNNFPQFCSDMKAVAHKFYYGFKPHKVFSAVVNKEDQRVLKELASDKDIVVSRPDKGRGVVIVNKADYVSSMTKMIEGNTKFSKVNEPINKVLLSIDSKINRFLDKLKKKKAITPELYKDLYVSGSSPGVLYGLPKIHKNDFSSKFQFRPIFAAYNCASYNLSKFLVKILNPIAQNEFTLQNSSVFKNEITNLPNSDKYFMASFDITDLYTNIPLHETVDICMSLLDGGEDFLVLEKQDFKTLLELSVFNSVFIFNQQYYKQDDGLGMGLPLRPILANIFLCHHEKI